MNVLQQLRDVTPDRRLSMTEAYMIAERQATLLLKQRDVDEPAVPSEAITKLPFVHVAARVGMRNSGATRWIKPRWVMLINAMEPPARQRFTICHELKHVIDHPNVKTLYRTETSEGRRQIEQLCDYFAGCTLMPRAWVKRAYGEGVQDVVDLANLFEVSPRAMQVRLLQLGLVDPYARHGSREIDNASGSVYLRSQPASPRGLVA